MPRTLADQLAALGVPFHNFYGMTETTGSITFTDPDASIDDCVKTIGKPDPHYEVRIADPQTGVECSEGEAGEIQVRSPGVLHSYLNDPDATQAAFTKDGFYKTGDLATCRADGSYALVGRLKEMFMSGGYNVYPREVEIVLESVPGVGMACVVPVPDPTFLEVGVAFIVPAEQGAVTLEALTKAARERLANYKVPKRFEIIADPPFLPSGKLDKKVLTQRACSLDSSAKNKDATASA